MIKKRCLTILLLTLIASCSPLLLFDGSARVSAQGPPYFPLQPSWFTIVDTYWGSSDTKINAAPGDTNIPFTVTIRNISNSTVTGISETLILQQPFTNMSGGQFANSFYEGSISPGSTGSAQFVLNIGRDATSGEHVLTMRIDYLSVASGVGSTLYIAQEAEVQVPVLIAGTHYVTIYSVIVSPKQVQPSGNITISGNMVNTATGSSFYNTNVSISSPAFSKTTSIFVGQIDPNIPRPFSATFQIQRNLPNGTYTIEILVRYQDSSNIAHVSSSATTFVVQQQTFQPPVMKTTGPLEILIDFLQRLFRFFFGSSMATIWRD